MLKHISAICPEATPFVKYLTNVLLFPLIDIKASMGLCQVGYVNLSQGLSGGQDLLLQATIPQLPRAVFFFFNSLKKKPPDQAVKEVFLSLSHPMNKCANIAQNHE